MFGVCADVCPILEALFVCTLRTSFAISSDIEVKRSIDCIYICMMVYRLIVIKWYAMHIPICEQLQGKTETTMNDALSSYESKRRRSPEHHDVRLTSPVPTVVIYYRASKQYNARTHLIPPPPFPPPPTP